MKSKSSGMILIVDDSELNRAILKEIFYNEYSIEEAENGRAAIEIIENSKTLPEALLLDIVMPELDGFGVLEQLSEKGLIKSIPVFLITSDTSSEVAVQGYESGVVDVINKPIVDPVIVRKRVNNAIELYRSRNHLASLVDEQVKTIKKQAERLRFTNVTIIDMLSSVIEFRSGESGQHVRRIRRATKIMLEWFGRSYPEYELTPEKIEVISNASAMHDIGKISIPDYILNKPGRLTADEFEIMKKHTLYGCEILQSIPFFHDEEIFEYCYEICRHHHERWDGRGYPDRLRGEDISIWAQVVSMADVYDALVSERCYKKAYPHKTAVKMVMGGECGAFNPRLLQCFSEVAEYLHDTLYLNGGEEKFPTEAQSDWQAGANKKTQERNVSEATLALLERERQKYHWLSEMADEILFTFDKNADTIEFTGKFTEVFREGPHVLHAADYFAHDERIEAKDLEEIKRDIQKITPESPVYSTEVNLLNGDGTREWYELYLRAIWDDGEDEKPSGYIGKLNSINVLKEEALRWKRQALHDYLTGLYNRQALEGIVQEMIEEGEEAFIMLFVDVDDFKKVNSTMGHLAGDVLLKKIAKEIPAHLRSTDFVARIGGDEFAIIIKGSMPDRLLQQKAEEICWFYRGKEFSEYEISISGSMGAARYPEDGSSYQALMSRANCALCEAKKRGAGSYVLYRENMESPVCESVLSSVDKIEE
ncbi:diguanylate cyclase [Lacrimispora sp. NSJ-141]|uniref:Stage 0 sporulation protein A homolog n=1 Tax=Lientehia hominis TaxID=2897778 RepID=A0AAP2W989_9FIRM|nr:diguanylate cyclase [Lientehia hominis]MCD2493001.1 diguanylate cyclase [Lientehia hominis]